MIRQNKSFIQPKDFIFTPKTIFDSETARSAPGFSIVGWSAFLNVAIGDPWTKTNRSRSNGSWIFGCNQPENPQTDFQSLLTSSRPQLFRNYDWWSNLPGRCHHRVIPNSTVTISNQKTLQGDIFLHFQRLRLNFETKRSKPDCRNGISVESCISSESTVD